MIFTLPGALAMNSGLLSYLFSKVERILLYLSVALLEYNVFMLSNFMIENIYVKICYIIGNNVILRKWV